MMKKTSTQPAIRNPFITWTAKHKLFCFCLLAAVWIYFLYSRALDAPFLYDDLDQIVNNPALHSWGAVYARFLKAPVVFTSGFLGSGGSTYRPVFWLSIALDWRLWGVQGAEGFHFTNIFLHWLNGVLVFQLLRKLNVPAVVAGVASAVWLGLPINTEVVAWISARAYLLSTFFCLIAFLSALAYVERKRWTALSLFTIGVLGAVFSHEQGLLLLPLGALLFYVKPRAEKHGWALLASVTLLIDLVYLLAKHLVAANGGHGPTATALVGEQFWKYLQLIFFPLHLSLERSTSVPLRGDVPIELLAWAGLVAVLVTVFVLHERRPVVSVALAAGSIALLPYCGFVYIYQGMAERFVYLAAIGFVAALAAAVFRAPGPVRRVLITTGLLWVGWGAWRLMTRVSDWTDPVSLYRNSLVATPKSPFLSENLGFALREAGDQDGALAAYQEAVRLRPNYPEALTSIGDIYAKQGKTTDALRQYRQSLVFDPRNGKTVLNYGVALQQAGDKTEAERQFQHVIALAPRDSAAYVDLGGLYNDEGRTDMAIQSFEKAIAVDPSDPDAYFDMAVMFQQRGQNDVAMAFYKKVLQLKPDDPQTLLYMGKMR